MRVRGDDRALALGIVSFFAILVVSALLFVIFDAAVTEVIATTTSQSQTTAGQEQIDLVDQIWGGVLVFATALALVFIIARSTFESRGDGL